MLEKGKVGFIVKTEVFKNEIDVHTADSKWQSCNCRTCQRKRTFLDGLPGAPFQYETFRHRDERY
jgi:hypothetical protein